MSLLQVYIRGVGRHDSLHVRPLPPHLGMQAEMFADVVEAVNNFAATHNPRLSPPAFAIDAQLTGSLTVPPPSYSQAQRALKVLCNIYRVIGKSRTIFELVELE